MESPSDGSIPLLFFSLSTTAPPMLVPLLLSSFLLSVVVLPPSADAIQCIINHEYTIDRFKDISMVKSTCYAAKYCVAVTYKDQNPRKKQGWSVGCDRTDCGVISNETGWERQDNGHVCKNHRDYGTGGKICCCTKDFCNGIGSAVLGWPLAALLMWVLA